MKITRLILLISILLTSCNEPKKKTIISDNTIIKYIKDGYNISIYISDFKMERGNDLNYQAFEFSQKKMYDKAREKLLQSLAVEPNNPIILNNLGNVEHDEYNFEKAIEYFQKSLIISDSLYVSAGINLGRTYSLIGEKEKSELLFKSILTKTNIDFLKGICFFELTRKHLNYGEIEKAKLSFSKANSILTDYEDFEIELNELKTKIQQYYD